MFDADRPIITSSQDRLNRTTFAKYLARSILDHQNPESFVIGLYGGWGVGKTSVVNMMIEELNFAASNMLDEEKPIILNFSPWSYSGQNQLIYSFFRRLSSTLRSIPDLDNADRIIHLLELYVSFFTHQPVPKSLQAKRSWLLRLLSWKNDAAYGWESGRDLTLVKAELNELLRQQKHKIIIIVDNISRLYDNEIKQIFQIVKSMGDYANTTYLLSFDKTQVIQAINHVDHGGGNEFIEKVIQLPFEVPPILRQDLESILSDRLNDIINTIPEEAWNSEYWADIYFSSLKFFFENCRDITRYVNTLQFSYERLRDIVNPVDFFALTAIEVFLPHVYFGIRDNKDLFTDLLDDVYALDEKQIQKDKLRCNEILSRADHVSSEVLMELLLRLFPRLRRIYQPDRLSYHSRAVARKLRRICSPDLFEAYFRLSMQAGQIPESEFETILSLANDREAFDQALTRLNQDERTLKFLDQLDSKVIHNLPRNHIPIIISALLDNGDLCPQGTCTRLSLDTPMRIHRIIHGLLQRFKKAEERFAILETAIGQANKSICLIIHELKEQSREHLAEEDTFLPLEFRDVTPEQLSELRKLAVTQIEQWAKSGRLAEHPHLLPILYAWRDWGNSEDCKKFVDEMVQTDRGLIALLLTTLDKAIAQAMSEYERNPAWEIYLDDIRAFIPIEKIAAHAKLLFEDPYFEKLREREQLALMIFLDLIKAKTIKKIPRTTA
ncbi:MAG: hypothetical protein A3F11_00935 [Gammaproteobacteria bacterium RIFCSPHIGHO2_12_FULL_37_14]|nr:MAG: hypothetical protein A3F11_00935 [Gammaproteobacteria bacterium RIFCSPHIGHO2_12_FULL_37_14]